MPQQFRDVRVVSASAMSTHLFEDALGETNVHFGDHPVAQFYSGGLSSAFKAIIGDGAGDAAHIKNSSAFKLAAAVWKATGKCEPLPDSAKTNFVLRLAERGYFVFAGDRSSLPSTESAFETITPEDQQRRSRIFREAVSKRMRAQASEDLAEKAREAARAQAAHRAKPTPRGATEGGGANRPRSDAGRAAAAAAAEARIAAAAAAEARLGGFAAGLSGAGKPRPEAPLLGAASPLTLVRTPSGPAPSTLSSSLIGIDGGGRGSSSVIGGGNGGETRVATAPADASADASAVAPGAAVRALAYSAAAKGHTSSSPSASSTSAILERPKKAPKDLVHIKEDGKTYTVTRTISSEQPAPKRVIIDGRPRSRAAATLLDTGVGSTVCAYAIMGGSTPMTRHYPHAMVATQKAKAKRPEHELERRRETKKNHRDRVQMGLATPYAARNVYTYTMSDGVSPPTVFDTSDGVATFFGLSGSTTWDYFSGTIRNPGKVGGPKETEQLHAETGVVINRRPSAQKAASSTGGDAGTIRKVCKGQNKTAGGFRWRYASSLDSTEEVKDDGEAGDDVSGQGAGEADVADEVDRPARVVEDKKGGETYSSVRPVSCDGRPSSARPSGRASDAASMAMAIPTALRANPRP